MSGLVLLVATWNCWISYRNDDLKLVKCFPCNQIRKRKRKSGACEVASGVETEHGYVTLTDAMTRNENSDDLWLQTAAKYKSVIPICGLQMFFFTKPVIIDLFMFIEKYRKKTIYLTRKYQASLQKKNSWF